MRLEWILCRRKETMEYEGLSNYGQFYTEKAPPVIMMAAISSLPREVGLLTTPRVLARLQRKERYWKKQRFATAEERGLTNPEFLQSMQYGLAVHTTLLDTLGEKKGRETTWAFAARMGRMVLEHFLPTAEDFLRCADPWWAVRCYFLEFFRVNEREHGMRFEIVKDNHSDFQVRVTDCAWDFIWREAGFPELAHVHNGSESLALSRIMRGVGGEFRRGSCLCKGDAACDWHFCRYQD